MKIIFIGRDTFMNNCFANWLAERHHLCAYFRADMRRYTNSYRRAWLRKRIKRKGILRAADEVLFNAYVSAFRDTKDTNLMRDFFRAHFGPESMERPRGVPYFEFPDLNGSGAVSTLESMQPDLVFTACMSQYLKRPYMSVPRLGTVLYHEGLTPEYKGLVTSFWANYNGEPHRIGYTLLQLSDKIDEGPPLAQGLGDIDPHLSNWWAYAGHKALVDGLPAVEHALMQLEAGKVPRVQRDVGPARSYSYPGLSNELGRWWVQSIRPYFAKE